MQVERLACTGLISLLKICYLVCSDLFLIYIDFSPVYLYLSLKNRYSFDGSRSKARYKINTNVRVKHTCLFFFTDLPFFTHTQITRLKNIYFKYRTKRYIYFQWLRGYYIFDASSVINSYNYIYININYCKGILALDSLT